MDELVFRKPQRGLRRRAWNKGAAVGLGAVLALQLTVLALRSGPWPLLGALALGALVLAVAVPVSARSWTRVGPDGITISWGSRRGRTYAWHQVRWIEIREQQGRAGPFRTVRLTPVDGRRRTLPWLGDSALRPDPGFEASVALLTAWWEAHADAAQRIAPARLSWTSRTGWARRLAVAAPVSALVVGALLAVEAGRNLPGALRDAQRFHAVPRCVDLPPSRVDDHCRPQVERSVSSVELADGGRGPSWIAVSVPPGSGVSDSWDSADGDTDYSFGALPAPLRTVRAGDQVQVVTEPDGSTVVGIEANGAFAPTEAAADSELGVAQAELIGAAVTLALGAAWLAAVLGRRRRRLPWWVPACLPAVWLLLDATDRRSLDPAPLDFELYRQALIGLAAGLAAAALVRWAWGRWRARPRGSGQ